MIRRALAATAAAGLGILLVAPIGLASENREVTTGPFTGSRLTTPTSTTVSNPQLLALIKRTNSGTTDLVVTASIDPPAGLPGGCETVVGQPDKLPTTADGVPVVVGTSLTCNGAYTYQIGATSGSLLVGTRKLDPPLESTLVVEVPPAAVDGVGATANDESRTVSVTWDASSDTAPDFRGYRVLRRHGSNGDWVKVADVGPGTTGVVDDDLPPEAGDYTYRVLGRRVGVGGDVVSTSGGTDKVTLAEGEVTTTTTADGTTSTVVAGDPGSTVPGDGGSSTTAARTRTPATRGRTGVGIKAPRLGTPSQANLPVLLTPTTVDEGYDEQLDYGDESIDDSALPSEESSSAFYENGPGKGMAVPVATGLVLFAWAIHLRFLARASRPESGHHLGDPFDPFDPFLDPMA
jgi:hypothetical protein